MVDKMSNSEREVSDISEAIDILSRADTVRLGLYAEPYPYVVPVSFGFELVDGQIDLYFHGAMKGRKYDLIQKNPMACIEVDIFHRYIQVPGSFSTEFESFIGYGQIQLVTGEEAARGLNLLCAHCGFGGFDYDCEILNLTAVYRIRLDSWTGKRLL